MGIKPPDITKWKVQAIHRYFPSGMMMLGNSSLKIETSFGRFWKYDDDRIISIEQYSRKGICLKCKYGFEARIFYCPASKKEDGPYPPARIMKMEDVKKWHSHIECGHTALCTTSWDYTYQMEKDHYTECEDFEKIE